MNEGVMSINNFNEPLIYDNKDAIALLLLRLILLEPGTNNTHPEMGVGIVSKFRFSVDKDLDSLNTEIKRQINTYLPSLTLQNVDLTLENKTLYITIKVNDEYYGFSVDEEGKVYSVEEMRNS